MIELLYGRVADRVRELTAIVNARHPGFVEPKIYYFTDRLAAGLAHFHEHKIGINSQLLQRNVEDMIHDTVAHEVAHLATWHLEKLGFLRRGEANKHGRGWKHVMRSYFGIEPKRGANYDISCMKIRRQRRVTYTCACPGKEHKVSTTRHKRIAAGKKHFRCVACRTRIVQKDEITELKFDFRGTKGVSHGHQG